MKATFFRVTWTTDDAPRINSVEFLVTIDENEEHQIKGSQVYYKFELDECYRAISVQANGEVQDGVLLLWQDALLRSVEKYLIQLDTSNADSLGPLKEWTFIEPNRKTYRFESLPGNGVSCQLETKTEDEITSDCFTSAWNSFTEAASEAFDSISKATASFFCAAPEPALYRFKDPENSKFKAEQIIEIEELINKLNKEIDSVWYPNKDLKTAKRDGLIEMLDQSRTKQEISQVILRVITNHPTMLDGKFSRTNALVENLLNLNNSNSKTI